MLNTHQHDDHAGGDLKMLPIAEVIAHKNARANLADIKQPYYEDTPGTPIGLPRVTFSDEASVFLGGKEVRAHYFGRGHTNGDAIIYFPELKVIHTGDLFLARAPPAAAAAPAPARPAGVNDLHRLRAGRQLRRVDEDARRRARARLRHGHPGARSGRPPGTIVVRFKADLETMRTRLAGLVRQGASKSDVVKTLEADYGWRATGCPPSPPTAGCLQFQQVDALIAELKR